MTGLQSCALPIFLGYWLILGMSVADGFLVFVTAVLLVELVFFFFKQKTAYEILA